MSVFALNDAYAAGESTLSVKSVRLANAYVQIGIGEDLQLTAPGYMNDFVHGLALGCFPNAHRSRWASVKNSGISFSPAATLSAGKLIRGFTLRTLGQLPSLWIVKADPSLACDTGPVVIRQGVAVWLKSVGFRRVSNLRVAQNLICIMRKDLFASSANL